MAQCGITIPEKGIDMESSESLLRRAMLLKPQDRFLLIDGLIRSLDEPDTDVDAIWAEEAENRLRAHREGRTKAVPLDDVFEADP